MSAFEAVFEDSMNDTAVSVTGVEYAARRRLDGGALADATVEEVLAALNASAAARSLATNATLGEALALLNVSAADALRALNGTADGAATAVGAAVVSVALTSRRDLRELWAELQASVATGKLRRRIRDLDYVRG